MSVVTYQAPAYKSGDEYESGYDSDWGAEGLAPTAPGSTNAQQTGLRNATSTPQGSSSGLTVRPGGKRSWGERGLTPTAPESTNAQQIGLGNETSAHQASSNTPTVRPRETGPSDERGLTPTTPSSMGVQQLGLEEEASVLQASSSAVAVQPARPPGADNGWGGGGPAAAPVGADVQQIRLGTRPLTVQHSPYKEISPLSKGFGLPPWGSTTAGENDVIAQSKEEFDLTKNDDEINNESGHRLRESLPEKMAGILEQKRAALVTNFIQSIKQKAPSHQHLTIFIKAKVLQLLLKSSKMTNFSPKAIEEELGKKTVDFEKSTFPEVISHLYPGLSSLPPVLRVGVYDIAESIAKSWGISAIRSGQPLKQSQLFEGSYPRDLAKRVANSLVERQYIDEPGSAAVEAAMNQNYDKIASFWFAFAKSRQEQSLSAEDPTDNADAIESERRQQQLNKVRKALEFRGSSFDILGINLGPLFASTEESDFLEELDYAYKTLVFIHPDKVSRLNPDGTEKTEDAIKREKEDRAELMQAINAARDTLKDPRTREQHLQDLKWLQVPEFIYNAYNLIEPTIQAWFQSSDPSKIDQLLVDMDSCNQTIMEYVRVHSKLPLESFCLPLEDLGEVRRIARSRITANINPAFDAMENKYRWFPKHWRNYLCQQPDPVAGSDTTPRPAVVNNNTAPRPAGVNNNTTTKPLPQYDPAWSKSATGVIPYDPHWSKQAPKAVVSEDLNPTFYVPAAVTPGNTNMLTQGCTGSGHRIIGHIPRQKVVETPTGERVFGVIDRKYFIDVGPIDNNGNPRNPLRWVDDLEEDEKLLYLQDPHEFVMKNIDFRKRPFSEFKCILGMAYQDGYNSITHLWVATKNGGEEIITRSAFHEWCGNAPRFRRLIQSFENQHNFQLPYCLGPKSKAKNRWYDDYDDYEDESYPAEDNRYNLRALDYRPYQPRPLDYRPYQPRPLERQQRHPRDRDGRGYQRRTVGRLPPEQQYLSPDEYDQSDWEVALLQGFNNLVMEVKSKAR